jgi:hypothetical protein
MGGTNKRRKEIRMDPTVHSENIKGRPNWETKAYMGWK